MDDELSMSEQCATAAKKANKGSTSRDKDFIIPLSACQATLGIPFSVLVPVVRKRCGQSGKDPEKGQRDDQSSAVRGKPENWICSAIRKGSSEKNEWEATKKIDLLLVFFCKDETYGKEEN